MSILHLPALTTPEQAAQWLRSRASGLQCDSRRLQTGDAFIAWPGAAHDARHHVLPALQNGVAACLAEAAGAEAFAFAQADSRALAADKVALYSGLRAATGPVAATFYAQPSQEVDVIAITGTNGKTSSAWWLAQALSQQCVAGAGLVGTLGLGRFVAQQPELVSTGLTTPDPVSLQRHLRDCADAGVQACVMEASSIGIEEHRLDGTHVRTAVFTNFTQDHLDYHGTMDAYWQAKQRLFAWPGLQTAVIHIDDAQGARLAKTLAQHGKLDVWTTSCTHTDARLYARSMHYTTSGLAFEVVERGAQAIALQTALIGQYNVANLLGVLAALRARGTPLQEAAALCAHLQAVPGRMECLQQDGLPLVAVDYAHTPDALEKALHALRPLATQRGGQLWCVFGCGGDRDPVKRPLMAQAAQNGADCVVVTSDNPRSEVPEAIIHQIAKGLHPSSTVQTHVDRAKAIHTAIAQADAKDVILIAGKGHEDYQEVHGVRHPFSDQAQVRLAFARPATSPHEVQP